MKLSEAQILTAYDAGESGESIATCLGVAPNTVYKLLRECGVIRTSGESRRGRPRSGPGCVDPNGYRRVRVNCRQVREHTHVAEESIGRRLLPGEVVHHINGDRLDNDPSNLAVMTRSEHMREHWSDERAANLLAGRHGWDEGRKREWISQRRTS